MDETINYETRLPADYVERHIDHNRYARSVGIGRKRTDLGNAERFIDHHAENVRFDHSRNQWLVWDGKRWATDFKGTVAYLARLTVRSIYGEAESTEDKSERKALADWGKTSESAARIHAMLDLAKSEPEIAVVPDDFDREPYLFNCANGTLDLRTGRLRSHDPADLVTKLSTVKYDAEAYPTRFLRFLDEITLGRLDVRVFLQRYLGYALTGDISEQCFCVWYGTGLNGKSTLGSVVKYILGDYAAQTPVDSLVIRKNQGIPNDLARLKGTRLVLAAEAEYGSRLAESRIKTMTGGDPITARFLFGEWFEYVPTFKLVLLTNHRPHIYGTDRAVWRRVRSVPFDYVVPESKRDSHLEQTLREEAPGILRWLVEGSADWQSKGLQESETVRAATEDYRREEDLLGDFLETNCTLSPDMSVQSSEVYAAYSTWCESSKEKPMSQKSFSAALVERGLNKRPRDGKRFFDGIGLK